MSPEKAVLPCPYPGCDGVLRSRLNRLARYKLRRHAIQHHGLDPDADPERVSIGPTVDEVRDQEVSAGAD